MRTTAHYLLPRRELLSLGLAAFGSLVATACGGQIENGHGGPGRLRLASIALEGGARWVTGIYDTKLAHDCTLRRFADGSTRCLVEELTAGGPEAFADAACSRPAQRQLPAPAPQWTVVESGTPGCGQPVVRAFAPGAAIDRAYLRAADGSCVDGGSPGPGWVERGPEIAPETFAEVRATSTDVGPGLARNDWVDDDGQNLGADSKTPFIAACGGCVAELADDGIPRCLPTGASWVPVGTFVDATCSRRFALGLCGASSSSWALEIVESSDATQPQRARLYSVSGYALAPAYRKGLTDGRCEAFDPSASVPAAALGAPRPATEFVAMPALSEEGTGRVRVHRRAGVQQTLHDATLDEDCKLVDDGSGTRRCLPSSWGQAGAFVDAACTRPAASLFVALDPNRLFTGLPKHVRLGGVAGEALHTFEVVGASYAGYHVVGGACLPISPPLGSETAPSHFRWLALGAEVPLSSFAAVP